MNVNYEKLDNVHGRIVVDIEEKDYADKVKAQLKELAVRRPEPGFRPGKTPMSLLRKKYGDGLKYDIVNREVGNAIYDYIQQNKLHVLGNPIPEADNSFDIASPDFKFSFKVGVAPEIDTHLNKDLHVPYYKITVSDDMVQTQDKALRRRFGRQDNGEVTDETCLVKGVLTELDENGSPRQDGVVVENGILSVEYIKDPEQKKLFADKKSGDKIIFNPAATCDSNPTELASMLNIDKADVDAHKGDFEFDLKEIIVLRPADHDQEFFDNVFGKDQVHNEEEYDKSLRAVIAGQLRGDSNYRFTIDSKKALMDALGDIELPDDVLKTYLISQNENLNEENIDEKYPEILPTLRWELLTEAILEQLDLKVTEDDLRSTASLMTRQQLAQYGIAQAPDEMVEKYSKQLLEDKNARQQVFRQASDMMLFDGIYKNCTPDEKEVSVEEFNALFTPAEKED